MPSDGLMEFYNSGLKQKDALPREDNQVSKSFLVFLFVYLNIFGHSIQHPTLPYSMMNTHVTCESNRYNVQKWVEDGRRTVKGLPGSLGISSPVHITRQLCPQRERLNNMLSPVRGVLIAPDWAYSTLRSLCSLAGNNQIF